MTTKIMKFMMYRSDKAKTPDTLLAMVSQRTPKAMKLSGIWGRDTVAIQLARLR